MYTLSMFNTGQITLPKQWRSQFKTTKFIAVAKGNQLIIQPLQDTFGLEIEAQASSYKDSDNSFGVRFNQPVEAKALANYTRDLIETND